MQDPRQGLWVLKGEVAGNHVALAVHAQELDGVIKVISKDVLEIYSMCGRGRGGARNPNVVKYPLEIAQVTLRCRNRRITLLLGRQHNQETGL